MVARIEMKLGMYAYYIISMAITCFHDNRILFEKPHFLYLHSSNLLTVSRMEVKLGTHAHYHDNSMRTTYCSNSFRHFSSNLVYNGSTHGDETWYACVLHHFHDKFMFPWRPHIVWTTSNSFRHSSVLENTCHMINVNQENQGSQNWSLRHTRRTGDSVDLVPFTTTNWCLSVR